MSTSRGERGDYLMIVHPFVGKYSILMRVIKYDLTTKQWMQCPPLELRQEVYENAVVLGFNNKIYVIEVDCKGNIGIRFIEERDEKWKDLYKKKIYSKAVMKVSTVAGIKNNKIYMGFNGFAKGSLLVCFCTDTKAWNLIPIQNKSDTISSYDSRYMCFVDENGHSSKIKYDCDEDKWVEAMVEGAVPELHSNLQLHDKNAPMGMWYGLKKKDVGAAYIFRNPTTDPWPFQVVALARAEETSEKETVIIKVCEKTQKVHIQSGVLAKDYSGVLTRDHYASHTRWNTIDLPYFASAVYKEDYIAASSNYRLCTYQRYREVFKGERKIGHHSLS